MPDHSIISNTSLSKNPAAENALYKSVYNELQRESIRHLPVQRKLSIGAVDDPLEDEADTMADKVMRMPEQNFIQRKCSHCEEEEAQRKPLTSFIQKKENGNSNTTSDSTHNQIQSTRGAGSAMPVNTKSFMESRFGADFSGVRIHSGGYASQLSNELHAQAFTTGNDIYFNDGKFSPDSSQGKYLLAHELTHVIQQSSGANSKEFINNRLMKKGSDEDKSTAPAETIIKTWLEENQFAPPASQPAAPEELHVILRGEDMTVGDAVKLIVENTHQPEDKVISVVSTLLARDTPYSARDATFVGPTNRVPGLPLQPLNPAELLRVNKAMDLLKVDKWLDVHHYYQPVIPSKRAEIVSLDGKETTLANAASEAFKSLGKLQFVSLEEVTIQLRRRYVTAPNAPGVQAIIGYTLIPQRLQAAAPADPANPFKRQHQLSFTLTWARHTSTDAGTEYSAQGSVTLDDSGQVLNIQTGGQAAYIIPLLHNWIQISGFVQLMGSANWNRPVIGAATITPAVQAAVGAQILFTPPLYNHVQMLHRHIALSPPQLGIQGMGTLLEQIPADGGKLQAPQAGASLGVVFNLPWDIN